MNSPSPVAYLNKGDMATALWRGKDAAQQLKEIPGEGGTRDGNAIQQAGGRFAGDVFAQGSVNGILGRELADSKARKPYKDFIALLQEGPFSLAVGENDQPVDVA